MSAEKKGNKPEDYINDVDRETLGEASDTTLRLKVIAELDKLEASGIHVDGVIKEIDTTPNHIFSVETDGIHNGDLHFGQHIPEDPESQLTYGQRTRAQNRRRTRNLGSRLLRKR